MNIHRGGAYPRLFYYFLASFIATPSYIKGGIKCHPFRVDFTFLRLTSIYFYTFLRLISIHFHTFLRLIFVHTHTFWDYWRKCRDLYHWNSANNNIFAKQGGHWSLGSLLFRILLRNNIILWDLVLEYKAIQSKFKNTVQKDLYNPHIFLYFNLRSIFVIRF